MEDTLREIVFRGPYGSANYNLMTPNSDNDIRIVVYPTMEDLYKGKAVSSFGKLDGNDVHIVDVRSFSEQILKGHPSMLETLFFYEFADPFFVATDDSFYPNLIKANLHGMFNAVRGNIISVSRNSSQETYEALTKRQASILRLVGFLERFLESGFNDFKNSIRYTDEEAKDLILIKLGKVSAYEANLRTFEGISKLSKLEISYMEFNQEEYEIYQEAFKNSVHERTIWNIKKSLSC
jgi:hypothetical protein